MEKQKMSRRTYNQILLNATIGGLLASNCSCDANEGLIDVHVHISRAIKPEDSQFGFDSLIQWMDENRIKKIVELGAVRLPENPQAGEMDNRTLLKHFNKHRDQLRPFCVIHPDTFSKKSEFIEQLLIFKNAGVIGFGELKPGNNLHFDDPKMIRIYEVCAEVGFPVLFHMDSEHCIDQPGLPRLQRVLKALPECTFIAHGPGWWASISGDVKTQEQFHGYPYPKGSVAPGGAVDRVLSEFPNLYADLSAGSGLNAIKRDLEYGIPFLTRHQGRLLFGTDANSPTKTYGHFEFYRQLEIPKAGKLNLLGRNAHKLLGI